MICIDACAEEGEYSGAEGVAASESEEVAVSEAVCYLSRWMFGSG